MSRKPNKPIGVAEVAVVAVAQGIP